jgi:hypothetical protein
MNTTATPAVETSSANSPTHWQPAPWQLLIGGILGGLVGFVAINQIHPFFPRPELPELGAYPSQALADEHKFAELEFHRRNGAFNCGLLGALLGLSTAIFSAKRKLLSGILSLILGAIVGIGIGYLIGHVSANKFNQAAEQSMVDSMLFHGAIFSAIGIAVWGSITLINQPKQIPSAIGLSILGGGLGALAYNVVTSVAYPFSNLSIVTPSTTTERAIWTLSCVLGLAVMWSLGSRSVKPPVLSSDG